MIYRIRIILDCKEDVIRDIEIKETCSFEDLHLLIINYFNFNKGEMASFYLSNDNWKQGDEIMLESFEKNSSQMIMKNTNLNTIVNEKQKKFIYVYDFLKLWTFFIEIFELSDEKKDTVYPKNIFSKGNLPKEAPEKQFIGEQKRNTYEDENLDYTNFDDYY